MLMSTHYLSIQVISKIVSQLEVKDLLNFRLVCRSWNAEATPALRKGIRHLKILPCGMRDFLRVYRRTQEPPVQSFSFHVENTEHMILLKGVSESLGHFVTSLRLSIASQELPSLPKILQNFRALTEFQLLREPEKCLPPAYRKYETLDDDLCLPHLTSICFGSRFPNLPFICNYDNFICEIINSSEKLETLEFQNWKSSLQHIFKFSELNSLRVLSLSGTSIKESEMATLTRKRLKLRQLKITLGQSLREETLTNFFESISDSLQVLDVASDKAGSNFHINSDLPELKVLRFQGPKCKIILDDFTANFPQLETVEFLDFEFIAFTDYRRKEKSLVKTLIARPCNKGDELAEVNIASLVAAFPNVTHFHGSYFNDSMCDAIFKYWRHLQALWLSSADNVTDFGITGVPNEILKTTKNVTCFCSNTMTEVGDSRINNHIGNLSGKSCKREDAFEAV